jgi:hypothetical protein
MKLRISGQIEFATIEEEQPRLVFSVSLPGGIKLKDIKMLALPNDQKVTASIQPVDAKGNPASIDGLAVWTSSSTDVASVQNVSSDSLSAEIVPGSSIGSCQINVQADADLGTGITNITGVLDVSVVADQAVGFTITTAPPVPITP